MCSGTSVFGKKRFVDTLRPATHQQFLIFFLFFVFSIVDTLAAWQECATRVRRVVLNVFKCVCVCVCGFEALMSKQWRWQHDVATVAAFGLSCAFIYYLL